MQDTSKSETTKWCHPMEVMKLHQLRIKKKALQARIKGKNNPKIVTNNDKKAVLEDIIAARKRKNPFAINKEEKKIKIEHTQSFEESSDDSLFKLLSSNQTSFPTKQINENVEIVKGQSQNLIPIDWTLKCKIRLWSLTPFPWNNKFKISEEASGVTGFTRCLDSNNTTNLDISPNARFHQCCHYWQQPYLPWLNLFPRHNGTTQTDPYLSNNEHIKSSLQIAYSDSLRSLSQLIRTRQCPYFYVIANKFTVLFRAQGICGFSDVHAIITPTTRGLRHMLKQENIEFTLPLRENDPNNDSFDDPEEQLDNIKEETDNDWLKSMGVSDHEIKKIIKTQTNIDRKNECETDNSEKSAVFVEGIEVNALMNFLINCKSVITLTGHLAGVPPTLLAPVSFSGATLCSLKVNQSKVQISNNQYYSLDLIGPILPNTIHNIFDINPSEHSMTATFLNINSTMAFSKINRTITTTNEQTTSNPVFDKENLSDCGLSMKILQRFCLPNEDNLINIECLKYSSDNKMYSWT